MAQQKLRQKILTLQSPDTSEDHLRVIKPAERMLCELPVVTYMPPWSYKKNNRAFSFLDMTPFLLSSNKVLFFGYSYASRGCFWQSTPAAAS